MRTFKISPKHYNIRGLSKARLGQLKKEGVSKARLKRSGLWDASCKSKLKIYRVGEEPKL